MKVDQLLEHLQQQVNYNQHIDVQKNTPSPPCSTPLQQHVNGHQASASRASSSSISPPNESLAQQSNILATDWATAFMRQHMLGQFPHLSSLFQRENINGEKVELLHTSKIGSQTLAITNCPANPESHCYEWTFANGRLRTDGTEHITFLCAACRSLRSRKKVAKDTPLPSLVAIRGIDNEIWWSGKGNGKTHCCAGSKKKAEITTRAIKRSLTAKLCLKSTKQTKTLMKKLEVEENQGGLNSALTPSINATPTNQLLAEPTAYHSNPSTARPIKMENSKSGIAEVPEHLINQGLSAVGGCRQCAKTFTDRLELIHHFCDHFPTIFYSFEELKIGEKNATNDKKQQSVCKEATENRQKKTESSVLSTETVDQGVVSTPDPSTNNIDPTEMYALMQQLTSYSNMFDSNSSFNSILQAATTSSSPKMALTNMPVASTHYLANTSQPQPTFLDNNLASKHLNDKKKRKSSSHKLDKSQATSTPGLSFTGEQAKPTTCMSNNSTEQSRTHRPLNASMNQSGNTSSSQDLPYHMCPHCCLTFAESQPFQDHLQTHLTINSLAESGSGFGSPFGFNDPSHQPKLIKCRFCDMRFSNTYRLAEHEKLHAQNCSHCNKIFMTVFDLNLHMGTHTGYTYDCKDCGKCFPCRKTLAEHNRSHRILLSNSSDDNSLANAQIPTTSAALKSLSVASSPFTSSASHSTCAENPSPLFCLDFSSENGKKESSKKAREVSSLNPTMEDLNSRRPESLFNSNPYFTELLSQNGHTTRKRRSRMGNSKRGNGEKSRKQTTLVAVELNPQEIIGSDGIPMATAITTNIQELQVKKESECDMGTAKNIENNEN